MNLPHSLARLALLGLAGLIASCAPASKTTQIPVSAMSAAPTGILSPGDQIRVVYPGAQELNTVAKIQPTGRVSLPVVGEVSASGRSVGSFQSQLTSLYSSHLQDPEVIVSMEDPASSGYVSGEVRSPGKLPLDRPMTALEAVMESGGFTNFANPKKVYVVRNEKGRHQRYVLNLSDTLGGANSQAFYLRSFDVVFVDQSAW